MLFITIICQNKSQRCSKDQSKVWNSRNKSCDRHYSYRRGLENISPISHRLIQSCNNMLKRSQSLQGQVREVVSIVICVRSSYFVMQRQLGWQDLVTSENEITLDKCHYHKSSPSYLVCRLATETGMVDCRCVCLECVGEREREREGEGEGERERREKGGVFE